MKSLRWCSLLVLLVYCAAMRSQGVGTLIPVSFYPVRGAPFTLTVETHWDPVAAVDSRQSTQRILRDSAGRQRYEAPVRDGVPGASTVRIYDVVAGKSIKLDLDARTAELEPMRVGQAVQVDLSAATSLAPAYAEAGQTLLGTREIAGLEAWGQRTVKTTTRNDGSPITVDRELWLSTHYRMPLMQVIRNQQGKTTQSVISFDAAEPDPALFQIPPGFAVSDAPLPPGTPPGTLRVGGNVSAPVVLKSAEPEVSEAARQKQLAGEVLVNLIVDERGLPQDVKVIRGVGYGMDEKAVEAVKQYRFKPALREGLPVKVELIIQVTFQIFGRS